MTSGFATVLAAASQPTQAGARASCRSPFSLDRTADLLEREARARSFSVIARLAPPPERPGESWTALLLVFGDQSAQTPVLQTHDAMIELPLALRVERREDGATEVRFSDLHWLLAQGELPRDLLEQVAALPSLVNGALRMN